MQKNNVDRVRIPELQTSVTGIQYDFIKRVGVVSMPDGCCVDMPGVISYFRRIDQNVERIVTVSGDEIDNCYASFNGEDWHIFPKEIAQKQMALFN